MPLWSYEVMYTEVIMFTQPLAVIKQCGFVTGMRVADLGAGVGHWSLALAPLVGSGKIYAIDIQKELLGKIASHAHAKHIKNIEVLWSDIDEKEGIDLRDASVDAAVICNALFQFEKKDVALSEAFRILRKNGFLLIVDWTDSFGGIGPQKHMVVNEDAAKRMCEREGFVYVKKVSAGSHHWGILMRKP